MGKKCLKETQYKMPSLTVLVETNFIAKTVGLVKRYFEYLPCPMLTERWPHSLCPELKLLHPEEGF